MNVHVPTTEEIYQISYLTSKGWSFYRGSFLGGAGLRP